MRTHTKYIRVGLWVLAALVAAWAAPGSAASPPDNPVGLRVSGISIRGSKQLPRRTLASILQQQKTPWYRLKPGKTAYDPFWAEDDRRRLELYYRSRGFYDAKVTGPELKYSRNQKSVKLTYTVVEGPPTLVRVVEIVYEDGTYREKDRSEVNKLIKLKTGARFELEPYQQSADAIVNYFKNWGFFRAQVQRQAEVDPVTHTAHVTYRVTRGKRYKIRSVKVLGTVLTTPQVVYKAIDLKPETWYDRGEVIKNQRRVQKLPIFKTVRVMEEADDEARRVDLTLKVEEGKPREARLGLGYGSEEQFRVQVGWKHVNFLGGAREVNVTARWSELLEREEIKVIQPNAGRPGNYIQLSTVRSVETEPAYIHESIGFSPTYHFILTDYLWAEISYKLDWNQTRDLLSISDDQADDLTREDLLSALIFRLEWADVDNPINPRQGARAGLYAEYGGGPLGGQYNYLKLTGEARGYYEVVPLVVAAARGKIGYAEPLGDLDTLPIFKRFFTGGSASVRGYERNALGPRDLSGSPIGGVRLWEGNIELRYPIYKELGGLVFFDAGWVWPEQVDFALEDIAYGYGFGFRYNTPIGPLALDVGFPLERRPRYPEYMIHFNVGQAF